MIKPWLAGLVVATLVAVVVFALPGPAAKQVGSDVYVFHHPVLVDLAGGGYATVTVGLEVRSGLETADEQSGIVREIVTNDLTNIDRDDLLVGERREFLKLKLARDIRRHTDVKLDAVLLTDFTLR
jgi:flagellar FliL protein